MAFTSVFHIECNQAAGMRRIVDAKTGHTIDLGIEPGVMVAKEADLRTDTADQVIKPVLCQIKTEGLTNVWPNRMTQPAAIVWPTLDVGRKH